MNTTRLAAFLLGASLLASLAGEERPRPPKPNERPPGRVGPVEDLASLFQTDVPAHAVDIVLGRPTQNSITASVLAYADCEGVLQYGSSPGAAAARTALFTLKAGVPVHVPITGLASNTQYFYRLNTRPGGGAWKQEPEDSFHTQRAPGESFTFTVQADPHLDDKVEPRLLERSMLNALADAPDFHIDLGDTFMTDKYRGRYELAAKQYTAQRYYFGLIGHSAPVFLVLGNHDGEMGGRRRSVEEAIWSNRMRKTHFANPIPDGFYTGDEQEHPQLGLREDYYAWQWGDALFVVLDPFWFSQESRDDNWARSLGQAQYEWLTRTLGQSRAAYKFIFLHHLVGGATPEGRGGVEAAPFYEWGGKNQDGSEGFGAHRPGWPMPIHQLLVQHHVTIVFHGHDHLFAKQDLDGIVYQEVPQPGNFDRAGRDGVPRIAAEYGYLAGKILGSPGYMRITVTPAHVSADLVRTYLPEHETAGRQNREIAYSYSIPGRAAE